MEENGAPNRDIEFNGCSEISREVVYKSLTVLCMDLLIDIDVAVSDSEESLKHQALQIGVIGDFFCFSTCFYSSVVESC